MAALRFIAVDLIAVGVLLVSGAMVSASIGAWLQVWLRGSFQRPEDYTKQEVRVYRLGTILAIGASLLLVIALTYE